MLKPAGEANYAGSITGMVDARLGVAILPGYAVKLADPARIGWRRVENPLIDREVALVQRAGVCALARGTRLRRLHRRAAGGALERMADTEVVAG